MSAREIALLVPRRRPLSPSRWVCQLEIVNRGIGGAAIGGNLLQGGEVMVKIWGVAFFRYCRDLPGFCYVARGDAGGDCSNMRQYRVETIAYSPALIGDADPPVGSVEILRVPNPATALPSSSTSRNYQADVDTAGAGAPWRKSVVVLLVEPPAAWIGGNRYLGSASPGHGADLAASLDRYEFPGILKQSRAAVLGNCPQNGIGYRHIS
jgi:hypothetical protein